MAQETPHTQNRGGDPEPIAEGATIQVPAMTSIERQAEMSDLGLDLDEATQAERLERVRETELSDEMREIVQDDGVLGDRDLLLWKWIYHIFGEPLTLETVSEEHFQEAREAASLVAIYITLIDDIGEKLGDRETFWELSKAAYPGVEPDWEREDINRDYAISTKRVWEALMDRIEDAPRSEEFMEPLMFSLRQSIQGMDYARLSADYASFMNPEETWYFETQAIGLYLFWNVDLMFSPEFDHDDYQAFRRIAFELQHMWRLGNWIITWHREVFERDYSAGIIVEALHQGIIDESDLDALDEGELEPEEVIEKVESAGFVEQFIWNWKQRRDRVRSQDFGMSSLDSTEMVSKMEWLMQSHFATEGHR